MSANDIAQILTDYLHATLGFADKIAGLVRPVPYGDKGLLMPFAKCNVGAKTEAQCNEDNPLDNMAILEDSQKSIIYFEQNGSINESLTPTKKTRHSAAFAMTSQQSFNLQLRLVCIANIRKLGYNDVCFEGKLNSALLSRLKNGKVPINEMSLNEFGIDELHINSKYFPTLSTQSIFGNYNQDFYKRYEYYPYSYTAIDLNLSAVVSEDCYKEFELKAELPPC